MWKTVVITGIACAVLILTVVAGLSCTNGSTSLGESQTDREDPIPYYLGGQTFGYDPNTGSYYELPGVSITLMQTCSCFPIHHTRYLYDTSDEHGYYGIDMWWPSHAFPWFVSAEAGKEGYEPDVNGWWPYYGGALDWDPVLTKIITP